MQLSIYIKALISAFLVYTGHALIVLQDLQVPHILMQACQCFAWIGGGLVGVIAVYKFFLEKPKPKNENNN